MVCDDNDTLPPLVMLNVMIFADDAPMLLSDGADTDAYSTEGFCNQEVGKASPVKIFKTFVTVTGYSHVMMPLAYSFIAVPHCVGKATRQ